MNQSKLLFYCLGVIFVYVIVVVLKGNTKKSSSTDKKGDGFIGDNVEEYTGDHSVKQYASTYGDKVTKEDIMSLGDKVKQGAATNYDKSQNLGNALSNITKTYTM